MIVTVSGRPFTLSFRCVPLNVSDFALTSAMTLGLETITLNISGMAANHRFRSTMSFAAIRPPPAIRTAAIAMLALALAKPAAMRNPVESSGVA